MKDLVGEEICAYLQNKRASVTLVMARTVF